MIVQRVSIENFQSIREADIELGKITILVGDSNAGKSAFLRAVNALTEGIRRSSVVSYGASRMKIVAYTPEWEVHLTRSGTKTEYKTVNIVTGEEKNLPKGHGKVPEEVLDILRPGIGHYAEQLDKPFLLADSGPEVARTLGELTNVDVVIEAARAGLKKRMSLSSELKLREADLAEVEKSLEDFKNLPDQVSRLMKIEDLLLISEQEEMSLVRLNSSIEDFCRLISVIRSFKELPDVPDISDIQFQYAALSTLDNLTISCETKFREVAEADKSIKAATLQYQSLNEDLHSLLAEAGVCPTCQQPIHG